MTTQAFVTCLTIPQPLALFAGGTASMRVRTVAPITVVWPDIAGIINVDVDAVSIYDHTTPTVDGSTAVWLVVFAEYMTAPFLAKEADYATLGTLVDAIPGAGPWAVYARIDGQELYPIAQV